MKEWQEHLLAIMYSTTINARESCKSILRGGATNSMSLSHTLTTCQATPTNRKENYRKKKLVLLKGRKTGKNHRSKVCRVRKKLPKNYAFRKRKVTGFAERLLSTINTSSVLYRDMKYTKLLLSIQLQLLLLSVVNTAKECFTNKESYELNMKNLKSIRQSCGDVCDTDTEVERRTDAKKFYSSLKKNFDCDALWSNLLIDEPSRFCDPPIKIPKALKANFTYNGRVMVRDNYYPRLAPNEFNVRFIVTVV